VLAGRFSLGKRIALLVVLGLAVVLTVFGVISLRGLRQSTDRALNERLMAAQLTAHHIDSLLGLYLEILSQSTSSGEVDPDNLDLVSNERYLERLHGLPGSLGQGVFLLNREGALIWSDPPVTQDRVGSLTGLSLGREIVAEGKARVSDGYVDPLGRVQVSLGVPVWGKQGQPAGAIVMMLDLTEPLLSRFVEPVSQGRTEHADVVDSRGMVLASGEPSHLFQKSDHTDQFASLIRAGQPIVGACHSCHETSESGRIEPEVLAFAPLSLAPWGVAIRQPEAEALAPARDLQLSLEFAAVASLLAVTLVALLASRGVVSPIRKLIAASRRMAAGDLESRIGSEGPAEIGQLARAFDEMREKLKSSLSDLEQMNSNLELRVEQRTRQLSALLEISKVLASTLELRPLLDAVVARTGEVLELADAGFVALYSERSGRLEVQASWGYGSAIDRLSVEPDEGVIGRVFRAGEPILLDTAEAIQRARSSLGPENRARLAQAMEGLGYAAHLIVVPLAVKGRAIGAMTLAHHGDARAFTQSDLGLAQALADQIAVAVENARLYGEVLEKEQLRGQLLDKVIAAQEEERRRIARELHDDTCQSLAALAINLEELEESLPRSAGAVRSSFGRLKSRVRATIQEVRTLALNLRPSVLDDLGLNMAIDWYAREHVAPRGLEVQLELDGIRLPLASSVETVLFRIAQESLNNVVKHSRANAVTVRLWTDDARVVLEVEDDGQGFDVEQALGAGIPRRTLGLHCMIERASLSGGVLRVSSAPGQGTKIRAELPLSQRRLEAAAGASTG